MLIPAHRRNQKCSGREQKVGGLCKGSLYWASHVNLHLITVIAKLVTASFLQPIIECSINVIKGWWSIAAWPQLHSFLPWPDYMSLCLLQLYQPTMGATSACLYWGSLHPAHSNAVFVWPQSHHLALRSSNPQHYRMQHSTSAVFALCTSIMQHCVWVKFQPTHNYYEYDVTWCIWLLIESQNVHLVSILSKLIIFLPKRPGKSRSIFLNEGRCSALHHQTQLNNRSSVPNLYQVHRAITRVQEKKKKYSFARWLITLSWGWPNTHINVKSDLDLKYHRLQKYFYIFIFTLICPIQRLRPN